MKKFFFLIAIALFIYSSSFATIRRVGFFGPPLPNVDYYTFAAAYTAANAGDTILMFPSTVLSGTLTKRLTIIGPGNWLDSTATPKGNGGEQADPILATAGPVFLNPGSDSSVITGFYQGTFYIAANNITIKRNNDIVVQISYNPAGNVALNTTGLQLLQNYYLEITSYYSNGSSISNMNISNNFMYDFSLNTSNTYSGTINQNVWAYDNTLTTTDGGSTTLSYPYYIDFGNGDFIFENNIIMSLNSTTAASNTDYFTFTDASNAVFNYNLISQSSNSNGLTTNATGNVICPFASIQNVFAAFPAIGSSSADARYQLGASSPALTVGAGSTAIGMYAGNNPYKLSTIPTIPSIYYISSPQGNNPSGSTIQINVSTRGNN